MLVLCSAGTVSERGVITCGCEECGAGVQFSSSEWEVHAGSRERRPAESIYISEHGISLRVCKFPPVYQTCLLAAFGCLLVPCYLAAAPPPLAADTRYSSCHLPFQI